MAKSRDAPMPFKRTAGKETGLPANDDVTCPFDPWSATEGQALAVSGIPGNLRRVDVIVRSSELGDRAPINQWNAAQDLLSDRSSIEAGEGAAAMYAAAKCIRHGLIAPEWLSTAFLARFDLVARREKKSWSDPEVFGRPFPSRARVSTDRVRSRQRADLVGIVRRFQEMNPGAPMERLWDKFRPAHLAKDQVGLSAECQLLRMIRKLGVGRTKALELWDELMGLGGGDYLKPNQRRPNSRLDSRMSSVFRGALAKSE